jgi:hypothetical protein
MLKSRTFNLIEGGTTAFHPCCLYPIWPFNPSGISQLTQRAPHYDQPCEEKDWAIGWGSGGLLSDRKCNETGVDPREFFARPQYGLSPGYMIWSIREKPSVIARGGKASFVWFAPWVCRPLLECSSRVTRQGHKPDLCGACARVVNNGP